MTRISRAIPLLAAWLLVLPVAALAGDADWGDAECRSFCRRLDAVEEECESLFGDGDALCEAIGTVEEQCDDGSEDAAEAGEDEEDDDGDESGRADPTCDGICGRVEALDGRCDGTLGEEHAVCRGLDALADGECEDEGDADEVAAGSRPS